VAAISERLRSAQADMSHAAAVVPEGQGTPEMASAHEESHLAAIALLRTIGSPEVYAALQPLLPFASPRLTAAALQALAATGASAAIDSLRLYLADPEPQIRLAALTALRQLDDPTLHDQAVACLDDTDAQVRAAALAVVLATPTSPAVARAQQVWHTMLADPDLPIQM